VGEIRDIVKGLVKENCLAVLWRRLLLLGARFPSTLGREVLPLAWAMPVLMGIDTSEPAGKFLKAIFLMLAPEERERVERTLLSIPDACQMDRREAGEHIRNRLLGCLADVDLVTEEARCLLADLQTANAVPPNEPPVRFGGWTDKPYSEEGYLARIIHQAEKSTKESTFDVRVSLSTTTSQAHHEPQSSP
jgi:hypothetical protein